ncbi:ABC transporter substrate-binding protein [Ferroacidibacillus organovorans]|uniref:Sugar ABC transporter substrate-binding protein n=1 Tax=Ferroacidibacillus organovorans TaxID=1765683 RepID=A0A101XR63_9BACL|nr:ABC transporter substrate-binding protein [Ferroacidibacillus organovorans]KUO96015.1 sugar ABC transporter substrate-binding protein [Ferroacidibacillus organovorans]
MLRQSLLAAFAVATGLASLTACSSPSNTTAPNPPSTTPAPTTTAPASGKVTITWAASPIANVGIRKKLIQLFEQANPTIKVNLISQPSSTDTNRASLITEISGGSTTPDVFMGDVVWPGQFAAQSLAEPLNKHFPASFFARFAPGLVQGATIKGNVYAAPFFMDAGFLYYRKDLLQKAHLPVPKTWEQLQSEAKTLVSNKMVKYGFVWEGASYEGLTCNWMEYLTDAGGQVFNAQGKPNMDTPAAQHALSFMRGLITSGVSPQAVSVFQEPQAMNTFNNGQAAFLRNWDYAWANSQTPGQSSVVGKVGVVPLPTFAGHGTRGYACIGGWDLYINPHTKHMSADLTFINWMTSVPAQTVLASQYSEIPTNASVQNSPAVRAKNPVLAIVGQTNLIARPAQNPYYAKVSTAIYTNVNAALAGQVSVSTALSQANAQLASAVGSSSL